MASVDEIVGWMRESPQNIRFADLEKVCSHFFGQPRQKGISHCVYKTPWPGDPRVNIQEGESGKAKAYQVRQAIRAIDKKKEMEQ